MSRSGYLMLSNTLGFLGMLGLLAWLPGCSSASVVKSLPGLSLPGVSLPSRADSPVSRILSLWEPSEGIGVDGKPSRGFAGQVLFFGPGEQSAVQVNGVVRVIEYGDFDPEEEDPVALHTFEFASDAWDAHRTDGSVGHSYSVFIPYVQKQRGAVNCALRVEYTGADGRVVASDTTEVMLPARNSRGQAAAMKRSVTLGTPESPSGAVRSTAASPAGAAADAKSESESAPTADTLETVTIRLPGRISGAGSAASRSRSRAVRR